MAYVAALYATGVRPRRLLAALDVAGSPFAGRDAGEDASDDADDPLRAGFRI